MSVPQADAKKRAFSYVSSDSDETLSTTLSLMIRLSKLDKAEIMDAFEDLKSNSRMKEQKSKEIGQIIQSDDDPKDIIIKLLRQCIPKKRTKKNSDGEAEAIEGYACRICDVAAKGHVCPYCEVCSTSEKRYEKGGNHSCSNCSNCYFKAKKAKKLKQVKRGSCNCVAEAVGKTEEI